MTYSTGKLALARLYVSFEEKLTTDGRALEMHTDRLSSDDVPGTVSHADIVLDIKHRVGDWTKWLKRLKSRNKSTPLRKLLSNNAMFWGQPLQSVIYQSTTARLLQLKANGNKQQDEFDWQDAADQCALAAAAHAGDAHQAAKGQLRANPAQVVQARADDVELRVAADE